MKFFSSLSLRTKLLLLILIAVLPALGIILFSGIKQRDTAIVSTKRDTLHVAKGLAAQQEQLAAGTRQMLKMLAQLPEVQQIDGKACNRLFRDIQEQNPAYAIINVVTPDGTMFAASMPFDFGKVNLADRKHIRDAIRTRDFSAGEYIAGRVVKVPTLVYSYPVLDKNGKLIAVVSAGAKLDKYKEFMAQLNLPEGSVVSMADHKNVTLYRLPEREDVPPGTPIPLKNVQGIPVDSKEGIYEGIGRDNVFRIYAYKRLWLRDNEPPYLVMYVGVVRSLALYQANIQLVYNLIILGVACLFAMLLAWVASNSIIVGPLSKLVEATQRFGKGEMHSRTGLASRKDELGRLAESFDTMAAMLETKDLERRKAEETLRENKAQLDLALKSAQMGAWYWDIIENKRTFDDQICYLLGIDPKTFTGSPEEFFHTVHPDDQDTLKSALARTIEQNVPYEIDYRAIWPDGSVHHICGRGRLVRDDAGLPRRLNGITWDITARKKGEDALKKSEEKFSKAFNASPEAIAIVSMKNGSYVEINDAFLKKTGFRREEIIGYTSIDVGIWVDMNERQRFVEELSTKDSLRNFETQFRMRNGETRDFLVSGEVVEIEGDRCSLNFVVDITDRKRYEEALSASQVQLSAAMELAHIVYWEFDLATETFVFNDPFYAFYGTTAEREGGYRMTRKDYAEQFVHPDDLPHYYEFVERNTLIPSLQSVVIEHRIIRRNGEVRYILARSRVATDDSGRIVKRYGANQDITERKHAEDQIKASLHEKEILLKEVHHRVKNNMQVISSLLNMQAQYIRDPKDLDAFRASIDRIKSMGLIHDKLYRSENLANIHFPGYVEDLVRGLVTTYSMTGKGVKLDLRVDPISLGIDNAIPLGLVINELVSNALKHAFPEEREGTISIRLQSQGDRAVLTISDNGIGFPEDLDFTNTKSLGMQLVVTLVEQLEGTIELDRNGGTEFRMTFKAEG